MEVSPHSLHQLCDTSVNIAMFTECWENAEFKNWATDKCEISGEIKESACCFFFFLMLSEVYRKECMSGVYFCVAYSAQWKLGCWQMSKTCKCFKKIKMSTKLMQLFVLLQKGSGDIKQVSQEEEARKMASPFIRKIHKHTWHSQ